MLTFEPAASRDIAELFDLYRARVEWMDAAGIRQWNATDYLHVYPREYYLGHIARGGMFALREETGRVVAAAVLLDEDARWSEMTEPDALYVHNLVTALDAPGVGSVMLTELERYTRERGLPYLRLDCAVDNAFLNAYYEERGYTPSGECVDGDYYGTRREKKL